MRLYTAILSPRARQEDVIVLGFPANNFMGQEQAERNSFVRKIMAFRSVDKLM
jgi:glutathione peroxidase-family protein